MVFVASFNALSKHLCNTVRAAIQPVSFAAVIGIITQRSYPRGELLLLLRDDHNNGCDGDYSPTPRNNWHVSNLLKEFSHSILSCFGHVQNIDRLENNKEAQKDSNQS